MCSPLTSKALSISLGRRTATCLGLPLSKRLVELHGGRLEIASAAGVGTMVALHFPVERSLRECGAA
jgi:two-component system cell cycle sensor histidine kinase PleC